MTDNSVSRPVPENRLAPSALTASRDSTAARASRTEVARDVTPPQRPVSAASLGRPASPVRSFLRQPPATSIARAETPVPESPLSSGEARSTTPLQRQDTRSPATIPSRPQSQQNVVASTDRANSRSVQDYESTRPSMQRPQTSLPSRSASQPHVPVYRAPQAQSPQVPRYAPTANPSYQQPSRSVAETPRNAPTPRTESVRPSTPAPSYQAPVRTYTAPQPTYQAPRQAAQEVPRYSPPAPQRAAPPQNQQINTQSRAPQQSSYSAPAQPTPRNAPAPSNSGRQPQQR